jgi:hypothetical protein
VASPFGSGTTPADTAVEFLPGGSYWYASANGGYAYDTVTLSYTVQSGTTMYEAGLSYTGSYTAYSGGPYEGYEYVQLSICPGLTTFVVNCAGEQTTGGGILSFTPTAVIGVQETVYFYAESESGYGAYAEVNSIENDFYDAPEPSTFSLLAIGLGAGWLLRRRRALRHSQLTSSIREEL